MDLSQSDPEAHLLATLPHCLVDQTMPAPYQHTNTVTGGRMLGVIIHGAIRNVTVSVKMGVNGMPWVWERRGAPVSHIGVPVVPASLSVGETNNSAFTGHLL